MAAVYVDIFHALFGVGLSRLLLRQLIVLLYRLLMTGDGMWSVGARALAGKTGEDINMFQYHFTNHKSHVD